MIGQNGKKPKPKKVGLGGLPAITDYTVWGGSPRYGESKRHEPMIFMFTCLGNLCLVLV